jgi:hypothetical protein
MKRSQQFLSCVNEFKQAKTSVVSAYLFIYLCYLFTVYSCFFDFFPFHKQEVDKCKRKFNEAFGSEQQIESKKMIKTQSNHSSSTHPVPRLTTNDFIAL